jgi:hypothetical protein
VRSDLEKLKGIKDITTDIKKTEATFKIAMAQPDLKKKLDEFAKTNKHMKDWSFIQPKKNEKDGKKA